MIEKTSPELKAEVNSIKESNLTKLGRPKHSNSETRQKQRPLGVTLPDYFRNQILRNSRKIRPLPNYGNIFIKKEMTRRQQQAEFKLGKKKQQRKNDGEDVII